MQIHAGGEDDRPQGAIGRRMHFRPHGEATAFRPRRRQQLMPDAGIAVLCQRRRRREQQNRRHDFQHRRRSLWDRHPGSHFAGSHQLAPGLFGRNQTRSGRPVHGRSSRAPAGPVELPQKWAVRLSRFDVVLANFNLQLTRVPQTAVAGSISPDNFSGDTLRLTFFDPEGFLRCPSR